MDAEKKRKQRDWERDVQRMRDEFLQLHAVDRHWGSDELIVDPLVARRRGSTDTLDTRRMKTMYTTSGSASHGHESPTHRRYRLRFDLSRFDVDSVRVAVSTERIVVRGSCLTDSGERRDFVRKVPTKPYHYQCGSMAQWLAHLEFELGDPGSNLGSRHYSIG